MSSILLSESWWSNVSDKEEGDENATQGNDWEVVSLAASAYDASPGLTEAELKDDDNGVVTLYEGETSHPLFMSRHFVSEHENLPLESSEPEVHDDEDFNFLMQKVKEKKAHTMQPSIPCMMEEQLLGQMSTRKRNLFQIKPRHALVSFLIFRHL